MRATGRSLRLRLTALSAVVVTLAVAAAAVLLVWRVDAGMTSDLDSMLRQRVGEVAAQARHDELTGLSVSGADGDTMVQVVDRSGHVLASSANIAGEARMVNLAATSSVRLTHVSGNFSVGSGTYHVATVAVPTPTGPATIYVARSTASIAASMNSLLAVVAVGAPVLVVFFSVASWYVIGRALRPVDAMRAAVQNAPDDEPSWRLPADVTHSELRHLAATFNSLLGRLEAHGEQQRRFLADAAHELRNPVGTIRTELDIYAGSRSMPKAHVGSVAAQATRLSDLLESLLGLARLDANAPLREDLVDLDDLVLDHVRRVSSRPGPVAVDATHVSAAQVIGDRMMLDRLIANLVDNALRHARHALTITLAEDESWAVFTVADDGPGIPAEARERVFERFARLEDSRARDTGGAGLGLAIVRAVAAAHGGAAQVVGSPPGAVIEVRLPRAA